MKYMNTFSLIKAKLLDDKGEVNMIAIVLILIVVIMLAIIFKDSMESLLKGIFERIQSDVEGF
ncbi:MAG: hypothetical protein GXZ08_02160 [Tissierellia bacterium]|nr:hypothetical protein [Tissierellia bacterium]